MPPILHQLTGDHSRHGPLRLRSPHPTGDSYSILNLKQEVWRLDSAFEVLSHIRADGCSVANSGYTEPFTQPVGARMIKAESPRLGLRNDVVRWALTRDWFTDWTM